MKRVDAFINPLHFDDARAALESVGAKIETMRDVKRFGRTSPKRGIHLVYRGCAFTNDVTSELELSLVVEDRMLERTIAALHSVGGEGEIVVSTIETIVGIGEAKRVPPAALPAGAVPEGATATLVHAAAARA